MGVWWSGAGETGGNITNVSDPGGSGNGNNQDDQNNQTGETGGHKLLDQYNKLVAEGKGGTTQAQELGRYLGRVEQKYQSGAGPGGYEGESLYPEKAAAPFPEQLAWGSMSEWDKIQNLASMEAADPKYAKSFEGKQLMSEMRSYDQWKDMSDKELMSTDIWRNQFGMPSIVATPTYYQGAYEGKPTWQLDPIMTGKRTDEFGQELGGEYIYSGQGRALMDQYEAGGPGSLADFDYGQAKEDYWSDRTAQEERVRMDTRGQGSYGSGGGEGGGGGYYGDPRTGNPIDRYGNFYTPQANLQQAMVNVHGTPTVFKKRGGIVSLLELRS